MYSRGGWEDQPVIYQETMEAMLSLAGEQELKELQDMRRKGNEAASTGHSSLRGNERMTIR